MFSSIRTLLLVAAITGVMALLSPVAHAITITRAEVQWDDAVVMGRDAGKNEDIFWLWQIDEVWQGGFVTKANKRGKFSFRGDVPPNCEGIVRAGITEEPVTLSNCTPPDSGEPGSILPLDFVATAEAAHNGEAVRAVGFVVDSVDNAWVISGGEDATLRTWYLPNLEDLEDLEDLEAPEDLVSQSSKPLDHPIYDFETSAGGSIVVTGEGDWNGGPGSDTLRIWPAVQLLEPNTDPFFIGTTAPIGFVYCVAISPLDSAWTVASGFYGEIVVYDTFSFLDDPLATKKTKMKRTKALAFSPDGTILASTSTAGRIQLWSFPWSIPENNCGSESCELERHPVSLSHGGSWVFPIAIAPYSTSNDIDIEIEIVSGSDGGMIKLWKIDLDEAPPDDPDFAVDSGAVYSLAYSPPELSMIVAGGNGDITVYNAADLGILFQAVNAHAGRVNDVAFSPDGSFIVSGGADGALKLWKIPEEWWTSE